MGELVDAAKCALECAEREERKEALLAEEAKRTAQRIADERVANECLAKVNASLQQRMVGLVVKSVRYDHNNEGNLHFEFADGTTFDVSAFGDDMTHIVFGFDGEVS